MKSSIGLSHSSHPIKLQEDGHIFKPHQGGLGLLCKCANVNVFNSPPKYRTIIIVSTQYHQTSTFLAGHVVHIIPYTQDIETERTVVKSQLKQNVFENPISTNKTDIVANV
jgi:hypothetical protein